MSEEKSSLVEEVTSESASNETKENTESYSKENTPSSARYAAFTGSVIFIFLATHWATFWYKFN